MIAILTEKPSVARDIARVLGVRDKQEGYFSGNGYLVTWAFGHLVNPALPEAYGFTQTGAEHLPILPDPFLLVPRKAQTASGEKPDPSVLRQLEVIKEVFNRSEKIIVATDSGKEGELIFRYIYQYLQCTKPFLRLWISSMTNQAIREGFEHLREGSDFDNLYLAARARSEADWLIGINASRALRIATGSGNHSLGRVQTPTLCMICERFLKNKHFKSTPYYRLSVNITREDQSWTFQGNKSYEDVAKADQDFNRIRQLPHVTVQEISIADQVTDPPALFDLTNLQKEANVRYGFTADKTLTLAQKLYEHKFITYPRTGSRYITADLMEKIPLLIFSLSAHPVLGAFASELTHQALSGKPVDGSRVTDHHALLITEEKPQALSKEERKIYDLIAGRMLEAFASPCVKEVTKVVIGDDEYTFELKGNILKERGWRKVWNQTSEEDPDLPRIPLFEKGESLAMDSCNRIKKMHKPLPLFTDATLLKAMENAGKELEEKEERRAMKDCGLGTPATRAGMIETLIKRQYVERSEKYLIPTARGLKLYEAIKDLRVADVAMTGMWENSLHKIETEPDFLETFMTIIYSHTRQVVDEILQVNMPPDTVCEDTPECPVCKKARVTFYHKVVKCRSSECGFYIYRKFWEKYLTEAQLRSLLVKGSTSLITGFRRNGKHVDGTVTFSADYRLQLVEAEKRSGKRKRS